MRRTSLWRCSCGTALQTVVEFNEAAKQDFEIAVCPICHELLEVDGGIVEVRAVDDAAASA